MNSPGFLLVALVILVVVVVVVVLPPGSHGFYVTFNRYDFCEISTDTQYIWSTDDSAFEPNNKHGDYPDGEYSSEEISQSFCTIQVSSVPPGAYCFYQNGREEDCPAGFSPGSRSQTLQGSSSSGGSSVDQLLTTGSSTLRTFYFCCGSGDPSTPISFDPIRHEIPTRFTVLRLGSTCQAINGRTATEGWVHWDDVSSSNQNAATGTVPAGIYDTNTRLYYCTYSASVLPDPVHAISLGSVNISSATLSWITQDSKTTHYKLQLKKGNMLVSTTETSQTSFSFSGLDEDTTYSLTIYGGISGSRYETVGKLIQFDTCPASSPTSCSAVCDPPCQNGACTSNDFCVCDSGFNGDLCDSCEEQFYGSTCRACPTCNNGGGVCIDGLTGDGTCACRPGYEGSKCDRCVTGYHQIPNTTYCSACHSSCLTCDGSKDHDCLSCPAGQFLLDSTCATSCPQGYITDSANGICIRVFNTQYALENWLPIVFYGVFGIAICILYFVARWRNPQAKNTLIISVGLSLVECATDGMFLSTTYRLPDKAIFGSSLFFTIFPMLLNLGLVLYVFFQEIKRQAGRGDWMQKHLIVASVVAVISTTNVELMSLLDSRIFNLEPFSMNWEEKTHLRGKVFGLVSDLLDNIPQLVIQGCYLQQYGADGVGVAAMVASALSLFYGIIRKVLLLFILRLDPPTDDKNSNELQAEDLTVERRSPYTMMT